jgi:hypothetical protein
MGTITFSKKRGRNEPNPNAITRQPKWWRRYRTGMVFCEQLENEARVRRIREGLAVGEQEYT